MVDDRAFAVAVGTGRRGLNLAQERTLDRRHIARAVAAAALLFLCALGPTGAVAILAGGKAVIADRLFAPSAASSRSPKESGHIAAATTLTAISGATAGTAAKDDEKRSSMPMPPRYR